MSQNTNERHSTKLNELKMHDPSQSPAVPVFYENFIQGTKGFAPEVGYFLP